MPKQTRTNHDNIRVVMTGGHAATTALSTIEELKKYKNVDYAWIGTKYAVEGNKTPTIEYATFEAAGVPFHPIVTGRVQKRFTKWTIPSLLKIPIGYLHAVMLLAKLKPDIVVSFGGFAAVPVASVAWCLGIPLVLHEQTAAVGRANKVMTPFAKKIAISRESSQTFFPDKKTVLTGNPIASRFTAIKPKKSMPQTPTVFVFCGSRGSHPVNDVVKKALPQMLSHYKVIHHTGFADYESFLSLKEKLSPAKANRYEVFDMIPPNEVAELYQKADIMLCRAGANTVSEVIVTRRPALFVPIPWSHEDEQSKNAKYAQSFIYAHILDQHTLTEKVLLSHLEDVVNHFKEHLKIIEKHKSRDINAAQKLTDVIMEVAG